MKSHKKFKVFPRERSVIELMHNCDLWTSDLDFIKIEISFLKQILISFPFKASIPNLFEKLQLFIQDLENLEILKISINSDINTHYQQLNSENKLKYFSSEDSYLDTNNIIAEKVLEYMNDYKKLKINIYEYVEGLIKQ